MQIAERIGDRFTAFTSGSCHSVKVCDKAGNEAMPSNAERKNIFMVGLVFLIIDNVS